MLTAGTVTNAQIRALRHEARANGDEVLVDLCDRCLPGEGYDPLFADMLRGECADAINKARARIGGRR